MRSQAVSSMSETIRPFSRELDTVAYYESRSHEEAFARLSHAIQERFLGVLTGEVVASLRFSGAWFVPWTP